MPAVALHEYDLKAVHTHWLISLHNATAKRACINSSTRWDDGGVVLPLFHNEGLPRVRNQCMSLLGASTDLKPICNSFCARSFEADFVRDAFL